MGGAERVDKDDVMARTGVDLRDVEDDGAMGAVTGADMGHERVVVEAGLTRTRTRTLTSGMFFDLNFPVLSVGQAGQHAGPSKRGHQTGVVYNATQLNAIEGRLDILVHCESTVFFLRFL